MGMLRIKLRFLGMAATALNHKAISLQPLLVLLLLLLFLIIIISRQKLSLAWSYPRCLKDLAISAVY